MPAIRRLMKLPGLDVTVAASVAAAIGGIRRFSDPQRLVAYLGLNPSVRQSGEGPALPRNSVFIRCQMTVTDGFLPFGLWLMLELEEGVEQAE